MSAAKTAIAIVRMHHISNPNKFRRLKRYALHSNVSGLVKTGKPGIVVFDGSDESVKTFLSNARGLRYLDFHHVATRPLPDGTNRIACAIPGLQEVDNINTLVTAMDKRSLKDWFRENMGMSGPG